MVTLVLLGWLGAAIVAALVIGKSARYMAEETEGALRMPAGHIVERDLPAEPPETAAAPASRVAVSGEALKPYRGLTAA